MNWVQSSCMQHPIRKSMVIIDLVQPPETLCHQGIFSESSATPKTQILITSKLVNKEL